MKEYINKLVASLDNHNKGFSARKLSALLVLIMVAILHIKWFKSNQWQYIAEILALDYTFVLVCLGLTTWQLIKEKKNEEPTTPTDSVTAA